ncbi:unnamed protein product [Prunus brigantina]
MNPPSPFAADGPILGLSGQENPALPPSTPRVETPNRQSTLENRMETLQREMIKMQEHNNILSSKLDDTQKQLHEQESRSAQLPRRLEQTTQLRQEQSQRSVPRPSNREAGEQLAQGRPSTSRRLFVPTPAEHHQEYQVYSDCRDRINHQRRERQTSPIHVQANLNDRHLEVLGPKSPPRRRYAEVGLEETDESDYVPTSLGTTLSRQSTTIGSARRNDRRQLRTTSLNGVWNLGATWLFDHNIFGRALHGPRPRPTRLWSRGREDPAFAFALLEDPVTHIHTFQSALGCKGLTDEGQCQLFPSTLAGAALNWFYRLEPGTVDSFDQLKQIFLNHFMIQTDRLYSADDLYTIRQGDSEPLREYVARFNHEYSRCPETDDRAAFGAFKTGLRASQFRYLVHSSNWTTYGELMK